jgi:hypothetical protein
MIDRVFRQLGTGLALTAVAARAYRNGRTTGGDEAKAKAENAYSEAVVSATHLPRDQWERLQDPFRQLRNAISGLTSPQVANIK